MDATELSAYSVQHNPWHASMYNVAFAQTIAIGGFVRVAMDTVEFDPSGMVTNLGSTSACFVIQQDGVYFICGAVSMALVADTVRYCTAIMRGASEVARGLDYSMGGAGGISTSSCWTTLYCQVGDVISINAQNFVTNRALSLGQALVYLSICYVAQA